MHVLYNKIKILPHISNTLFVEITFRQPDIVACLVLVHLTVHPYYVRKSTPISQFSDTGTFTPIHHMSKPRATRGVEIDGCFALVAGG